MALVDQSSIPSSSDKKLVHQISKIFDAQLDKKSKAPSVSIFQVPENITTQKPEAYEPQQIGLGPNHHFRPRLYNKMEQKKFVIVQRVLQEHNIKDFKLVLDKVRNLVPLVRPCYDMFLQEDDDSLAWIFAIDGLFLLALFHPNNNGMDQKKEGDQHPQVEKPHEHIVHLEKIQVSVDSSPSNGRQTGTVMMEEHHIQWPTTVASNPPISEVDLERRLLLAQNIMMAEEEIVTIPEKEIHRPPTVASNPPISDERPKVDPERRLWAQDIIMLENQIPLMVLIKIREALQQSSGNSFLSDDNVSPSIFRSFSDIHSPLGLCLPSKAPSHVEHLLDYMYHSIVNVPLEVDFSVWAWAWVRVRVLALVRFQALLVRVRARTRVQTQVLCEVSIMTSATKMLALDDVPTLIGQAVALTQKIPQDKIAQSYEQIVKTIENFSVSKTAIPSASKLKDIAQVEFQLLEENKGIWKKTFDGKAFSLRRVTLNNDSEVILRNLVAYETLMARSDKFPLTSYMGLMCGLIVNANDVKILRDANIIKGDLGDDEVAKLFIGMSSSIPSMKTKKKSELQKSIERVNEFYGSQPRVKMILLLKKLAHWLLVVLRATGGFVGASWKIVAFIASIVTVFMLTLQAYCDVYGCDKTKITFSPYAAS